MATSKTIFLDKDLQETLDIFSAITIVDDGTKIVVANSPIFSPNKKSAQYDVELFAENSAFKPVNAFDDALKDNIIRVQVERIEELLLDLEKANALIGELESLVNTLETAQGERDRIIEGFQKLKVNYDGLHRQFRVNSTCKECGCGTASERKPSKHSKSSKSVQTHFK
jgi:hypothetical protein